MTEKLININIHDDESLLKACDLLHDAHMDISDIKYNEAAGTLEASFECEYFEDPSKIENEKKYRIFNKTSFPMVHSVLFLEGIETYRIENKSKIENFSFNECRIKEDKYKFVFCENMVITITFKKEPSGYLKDLRYSDKKGSILTFGKPHRIGTS